MERSMALCCVMTGKVVAIPDPNSREHDNADEREQRKPDDLPAIDDDRRGQERAERAAGVAADLEDRLGEAEPTARAQMRHARRFRMKNRRADADECDREKNEREIRR